MKNFEIKIKIRYLLLGLDGRGRITPDSLSITRVKEAVQRIAMIILIVCNFIFDRNSNRENMFVECEME